ncbi:unnamed protein product [Trichogramma brassicae]|uniref:Uncharacterized protein n=1 Tax=Trichogramma brassicae TaxID=86971 RepID=A0A6H5J0Y5_9HYME|nr:unnamed protein product [Trichogramma brassicae]
MPSARLQWLIFIFFSAREIEEGIAKKKKKKKKEKIARRAATCTVSSSSGSTLACRRDKKVREANCERADRGFSRIPDASNFATYTHTHTHTHTVSSLNSVYRCVCGGSEKRWNIEARARPPAPPYTHGIHQSESI